MTNKHFAVGGENAYGHSVVFPQGYDPAKKYPTIFFLSGIGETAPGSLSDVTNTYNWVKSNSFLLDNVDKYGFLLFIPTYPNTTTSKSKVAQWMLSHAKAKYSVDERYVAFIGHSNGSHTLGTWSFADPEFAKQVAVWICSASGPFSTPDTFKNVAQYDVRIWGITAVNDAVISTNYVQQLGTKVPALNPQAVVVITKFPATRFPDGETAHNIVLGQITKSPLPFVSLPGITDRLGGSPRMDMYQFILSNPKGSIPQLPDQPFTGAKFEQEPIPEPIPEPTPEPQPEPTPEPSKKIKRANITGKKLLVSFQYEDNTPGKVLEVTQVDSVRLKSGKMRFTLFSGKIVVETVEI